MRTILAILVILIGGLFGKSITQGTPVDDKDKEKLIIQAVFSLIGLLTLVTFRRVPYRLFRFLAYPLLGLSMLLLVGVCMPGIGIEAGGARRWLVPGSRFRLGNAV